MINIHLGVHLGAISCNQNDCCLERQPEKDILTKLVVCLMKNTLPSCLNWNTHFESFYSHVLPDFLNVSLHTLNQYSLGVKLNCHPLPVDSAIQLGITDQCSCSYVPLFDVQRKLLDSVILFAFLHLIKSHWDRLLSPKWWILFPQMGHSAFFWVLWDLSQRASGHGAISCLHSWSKSTAWSRFSDKIKIFY